MTTTRFRSLLPVLALLFGTSLSLHAHPGHGDFYGFAPGAVHPFSGLDHLLAMVAVGLWAAQLGGRSRWAVPMAFVGAMLVGGAVGMTGVHLPLIESGILVSVFLLGLLIAFAVRLPLAATAALVGLFAFCHGFAHGAEAPASVSGVNYAIGFALATASLHAVGISMGVALQRFAQPSWVRAGGVAVIALGALLLV